MARTKRKVLTRKINKSKESKSASRKSNARDEHIEPDNDLHNENNSQASENSAIQSEANSENNDAQNEENSEVFEVNEMQAEGNYETAMKIERPIEAVDSNPAVKIRTRGPIKLKSFPPFPFGRIEVEFNQDGEPIGPGSVKLSSYLGPLVREHVPVTLNTWRRLSDDLKVVLWQSIQDIFKFDKEWQKVFIFKKMGCFWRASKCRLIRQIEKAKTEEERLKLKPANVKSEEWKEFIELKTSLNFKTRSEIFKTMRRNQMPHTCGRKGMARLAEELRGQSHDPSSVSRAQVWIKSRIKKNGEPVSMMVADTIEKIKKLENEPQSSSTTNVKGDALSQVLGRPKAIERGNDKQIVLFQNKISKLEDMIHMLIENQGKKNWKEDSTFQMSKHGLSPDKCDLLDWSGTDEIVAEGRVVSSDPNVLVHKIPLGPNAMKILIDCSRKDDTYLWRPTPSLTNIGDAEDEIVAWPANRVVMRFTEHSKSKDNAGKENWKEESTSQMNKHGSSPDKCDLLDWSGNDEIVAEGRVVSSDPNVLVHKIPLGPNAMKILIDCPRKDDAYLWRPTPSLTNIGEAKDEIVAWPANRVVMRFTKHSKNKDNASKTSRICKLYDWSGSEELVAEGRLHSSDLKELVNGIPLGPSAAIVWVDNPIKGDVFLWRPIAGMTCVAEAVGSKIAWPESKVVVEKVNPATSRAPTFNAATSCAPTFNAATSRAPTFNTATSCAPTVNSAAYHMSANSMVKNKCKLIDLCGTGEVVAEGRAIDPNKFAPEENAVKVSVDVVKVPNVLLWRPSWKFKYIEDVVGNIISWPAANVIMESNYTPAGDKGLRSKRPKNDASAAVDKGSRSKKSRNEACEAINDLIQVINTCHE